MPKKRRAGTLLVVTGEKPVSSRVAQIRRDNTTRARIARRKILERTARARAQIAAMIADADMSDLAHLPVIVGLGATAPTSRKRRRDKGQSGHREQDHSGAAQANSL